MVVTDVATSKEVRILVAEEITSPGGGSFPSVKPPEAGVSPALDAATRDLSGAVAVRTTAGLAVGCTVVGLAVGSALGPPVPGPVGFGMAPSIALSTPRQSRER